MTTIIFNEPKPVDTTSLTGYEKTYFEKYNLQKVDISYSRTHTSSSGNEFVAYFKKRLVQFLIRQNPEYAH